MFSISRIFHFFGTMILETIFFFRYNPMLNFATTPYFSSGPILSEVLEFKRTWIYSNGEFHFKQSCSMVFEKDFSLFIPLLKFSSSPPRVVNSTLKVMIQTNLSLHHRRMLLHIFCLAKWCLIRLQVIFFFKMYSDVKLNPFLRE